MCSVSEDEKETFLKELSIFEGLSTGCSSFTPLGTNISLTKAPLKMMFLFPMWGFGLVPGGYSFEQ